MIGIDQLAYASNLRCYDPKSKCLFGLVSLLIVVITRSIPVSVLAVVMMGSLTLFWGRTSCLSYLRLLLGPIVFLSVAAIAIIVTISKVPLDLWNLPIGSYYVAVSYHSFMEGIKVSFIALGAISCMYFVSLSTPMVDLLLVLRKWHVPELLIEIMLLTYRFIFMILDITTAITVAQKCRLGNITFSRSMNSFGQMLAATLIRCMAKTGRMYDAMEARGYEGSFRVLTPDYKESRALQAVLLILEGCFLFVALL